ncbi:MAG TPA: DNA ligase D [Bryobacteraceae bacterium]|nr:DNA ligase D [Bryobacteraceae bacterium]
MSLDDYARKRKFTETPEPPPAPGDSGISRSFCVQRHHATRLHYDFRLEAGGTLKSWAVPKGPTLDPSEKRLAMMVEDHPLEYGGFEGTIPAGNYGAGSVMLWDRGQYELLGDKSAEQQLERGDFKFRLHGEKLNGEFALVRMKRGKGNEWLLLKKRDAFATPGWDVEQQAFSVLTGRTQEEIAQGLQPQENAPAKSIDPSKVRGAVRAPMLRSVTPMLASIATTPPAGDEWLFEVKWDGVRALCFVTDGKAHLVSRKGTPIDRQYPELSVLPHQVAAGSAILDGEIAILDERGVPSFQLLQRRITVGDAATIAALARKRPVTLILFDLLYLDGYDLRGVPLIERKKLLKQVLNPAGAVRYSDHFVGKGMELLEAARQQGLEGIVGKRADSTYDSKRSDKWLKIKVVAQQEFVICGYTEGERDYFGSLVLGLYEKGKLVYVGNVGTGFDHETMAEIFRRIEPLTTARRPFSADPKIPKPVVWVRPELVCEVRFASWTEDNHLRAPVYLGLRTDLDPKECVREQSAAEPEVHTHSTADARHPAKRTRKGTRQSVSVSDRAAHHVLDAVPPEKTEASVTVDDRRLKFTNLNKLLFPKDGYTKRDVIEYYDAAARFILPHLKDRPLSLKRYPNGIDSEWFFQKDAAESFPDWLRFEEIPSEHSRAPSRAVRFVVGDDRATLLYLANLGCIDQNPWMSRVGSLDHPDFILVDLDPHECRYEKIVEAAQLVRRKLDLAELEGYPKTTGGDGLHIYVPVAPRYTYEQTRAFAEILARLVAAERPDLFTTGRAVARREKGKVYFDYLQNAWGKTASAPYVLRAFPRAPVATPLEWREVASGLDPAQFHIRNALDRFERVGDLFQPVLTNPQRLEPALQKLGALIARPEG